jgi:putative transposase
MTLINLLTCSPETPPVLSLGFCSPLRRQAMREGRFTEEQIIKVLKEHAAGLSASDLCRKHGISDATFYKWRSRYGGMEISDARKLKGLEEENRKLKKLLAASPATFEINGRFTSRTMFALVLGGWKPSEVWQWQRRS